MGKKVKKLVKKVTKTVAKVGSLGAVGGGKAPPMEAPATQMLAQNETPKDEATEEIDKDTEAARKAAKRGGKQGLSVARAGGSGLNI
ncbi:host range and adsorption protein [Pseudomonas phage PPpW-4]|uniref:Putative tail assembly protein n=1 Tax=Pseudomonas phage PPpW-4 TaxID=1279083 RepID=V5YSZ6_9CAUD|nr:host range and adsorption protein [Pseudomonas phage PPpW-4]BAO20700.1 putative tail assembly protein [Pseudomonas phage PPpW-4]